MSRFPTRAIQNHVETSSVMNWQVESWQMKKKGSVHVHKNHKDVVFESSKQIEKTVTMGKQYINLKKKRKTALILRLSNSWLWGAGDLVPRGVLGWSTIPFAQNWGICQGCGAFSFQTRSVSSRQGWLETLGYVFTFLTLYNTS